MSELFNNDVLCGALYENGEYAPVYCNVVTGECHFSDPVMSYPRLISEVSIDSPVEVEFADIVAAMEEGAYGECIGVIYCGESVVKLVTDVEATIVPVASAQDVGELFSVDIYSDYEEV